MFSALIVRFFYIDNKLKHSETSSIPRVIQVILPTYHKHMPFLVTTTQVIPLLLRDTLILINSHIGNSIHIQCVCPNKYQTKQKINTCTIHIYPPCFFLPCGVGIFHCYIELLLVFFFHRNDCSLPYLELGTAPSKWGVFVKQ